MAYRRRRSRGTRGLKCRRYKRVRVRGQGYARRCASYGRRSGSTSRRRRRTYRRRRSSARKPRGMAKRGSRCTRYKRVRLRRKVGGRRYVRRCAHYRAA